MTQFKNQEGSLIEVIAIAFSQANGSDSVSTRITIDSHGFSAALEEVWFYKDDLTVFSKEIGDLLSGKTNSEIKLVAMSDFLMSIQPANLRGHFKVKARLEDPFHENSADIGIVLESQAVADLGRHLRTLAKGN